MLTAEVDRYIKNNSLIESGSKMMVGVSGGPDSMALLQYLLEKRETYQLELIAVIIEHGLRGEESIQDIDYVRTFCEQNHIQFEAEHIDVGQYKREHKLGTQEAARILRFQAFDRLMKKYDADYLALAHHADDQVETVYMRLTRGTQLDSLQGIKNSRQFSNGRLIRPFLSVTKEMIEKYCAEKGIVPRRDISNEEDSYTRNYFRLNVLPLLKEKNPNLSTTIMHMTDNIAQDIQYLTEQTKKMSEEVLSFSEKEKKASCQINRLKSYPLALQRRLFHLILDYLYDHLPKTLNYKHEQQFFDLINSNRANASVDLPLQLKMIKSYQLLTFTFNKEIGEEYHIPLVTPGRTSLPNGDIVTAEIIEEIETTSSDRETFYVAVKGEKMPSLVVRTRMPGDRIYLPYINGRKKIKSLFIDNKIPLEERERWPLLARPNGEVLWVVGLAKSHVAKQEEDHYLKITYHSSQQF